MPAGSGRKVAPEWNEFTRSQDKSRCKHCGIEVSSKIERLRVHLKKCAHYVAVTSSEDDPPTKKLCTEESDDVTAPSCSQTKQSSMEEYTIKTSDAQKHGLDRLVANFFYANNIPFNAANSTAYKHMMQGLRPGYEGPTAKAIGSHLLDHAADAVDNSLRSGLTNATLTLVQDGWSNVKNDAIIGSSIHTGTASYLLEAVEAGPNKKTAEFCAQKATESIQRCRDKLGLDVFAVCTDNENKMKCMKELLKQEFPQLITVGCSAHYMNLVEKEVTPNTVMKHLVEVQKHFSNVHQTHEWLKEKGGLAPKIPNATRWNSHLDSVNTFVTNYHLYKEIRSEQESFSPDIAKTLDNIALYREAQHLLTQLKFVGSCLDKLQADATTLSDAFEIWKSAIDEPVLAPFKKAFEKRCSQAMEPVHFLANMTDPRYYGQKRTSEQEAQVKTWLTALYAISNFASVQDQG